MKPDEIREAPKMGSWDAVQLGPLALLNLLALFVSVFFSGPVTCASFFGVLKDRLYRLFEKIEASLQVSRPWS